MVRPFIDRPTRDRLADLCEALAASAIAPAALPWDAEECFREGERLRDAGQLRDGASFTLMGMALEDLAQGRSQRTELERLAARWRAEPGTLAAALGEAPILGPGDLVAIGFRKDRCMGDTTFYIQLLDPPSGTEISSLIDVAIEGVAIRRDGLVVYAQWWWIPSGERRMEVRCALTGRRMKDTPQPASADEVVMLADLLTEVRGDAAPKTPLQIILESTPPGGKPAFVFGA